MRLLIRADSSRQMGAGHAMRCLALAQSAIDRGDEVVWASATMLAGPEARIASEAIVRETVAGVPGSGDDIDSTLLVASKYRCSHAIVDGYQIGPSFDQSMVDNRIRCLRIDDIADQSAYPANFVLNQNVYARAEHYAGKAAGARLLLGLRYLLMRREFEAADRPARRAGHRPRRVLVTFGGADPTHSTARVAQLLVKRLGPDAEVVALVGAANDGAGLDHRQITVLRDVHDMPGLLGSVDAAVSAAGSTVYELAWARVPTATVCTADNQRLIARYLGERVPEVTVLDPSDNAAIGAAIDALLGSAQIRERALAALEIPEEGSGTQRVLNALEQE